MSAPLGVGLALIAVAAFHLIPAALTGEIPTTTSRRIRRHETEFWITCGVFSVAAAIGLGLVVTAMLR